MSERTFKGFAGVTLRARVSGAHDAPAVLLLHGPGETGAVWSDAAEALARAGRQVISLDLRGHGVSDRAQDGRYEVGACVEDLRAVLAQLASRPVVVASALSGWIALLALGEDGGHLATALVLADAPAAPDAASAGTACERAARIAAEVGAEACDPAFLADFDPHRVIGEVTAAAERIAMPVLFVHGARSPVTATAELEPFLRRFPDAEAVEVDEAGHLVAADRSDLFSSLLLDFLERRVPRDPPEFRSGSDARTLRDALGCFATGVTVVTAKTDGGEPIGLTANSFTSVSLDPPLLLVCIARTAGSFDTLVSTSHFAVNVLHIGQQPTSNLFAKPGEARFEATEWASGLFDVPLLTGSLANFECARHAVHDGGDHIILVGRVERATFEPRRDPLLYFRGKYRRLHFA